MNRQLILQYVDKKYQRKEQKLFRVGDTVRVHVRISEGDTTRVQVFEGVVLLFQGQGGARIFTVRKISFGVGVERSFPLYSPTIEKIDVLRSGHTRRAKLYYLRKRVGRAARLEEKESRPVSAKSARRKNPPNKETPPSDPKELVAVKENE